GVVGVGTMGRSIAEMLAVKGLDVMLVEKTESQLNEALELLEASLDRQLERWAITLAEKKLILNRIHKMKSVQDLAECDLVIEAASEDLEVKKQLFKEL